MNLHVNEKKIDVAMEILSSNQSPLFTISLNQKNLGNWKYGSPEKSLCFNPSFSLKPLEPKLFNISCLGSDCDFERTDDMLSFYLFHGAFGKDQIEISRPIPAINRNAYLKISKTLGSDTVIEYNSLMRKWCRFRFSQLPSISEQINDLITLKLLQHDHLSFHAAGFEIDSNAYLITGLPDTGKTFTTMKFIENGANFISEDIVLIDPQFNAIGMPFTATIEKRGNLPLLKKIGSKIFEFFIKENHSKNSFLDIPLYDGNNVCHNAPIKAIFFLKRGKSGYRRVEHADIITTVLNVNRLEFTYWRNTALLTYLFFQDISIDQFLKKESDLLDQLIKSIPVYEVSAPDHEGYRLVIEGIIDNN